MFKHFVDNIQYPSYEIIVVDNASQDNSVAFLEDLADVLPLKLIENKENESFSRSNNQGAEIAQGKYLLLLNNDVEPTYGWLNHMMKSAIQSKDVGAVGAKMVYPDCSGSRYNKSKSFKIQHEGIAFIEADGFIKPYNRGNGEPFKVQGRTDESRVAVTAAALLVERDKYFQVNGLDEKYIYGYEDVDFCLKLLKNGYNNIYCPNAVLFHYEFGTQEKNRKRILKSAFEQ